MRTGALQIQKSMKQSADRSCAEADSLDAGLEQSGALFFFFFRIRNT